MPKYLKSLDNSFGWIEQLNESKDLVVSIPAKRSHLFHARTLSIRHEQEKYLYSIVTSVRKGVQKFTDNEIPREKQVIAKGKSATYYTLGKYVLANTISYPDTGDQTPVKKIEGEITAIASKPDAYYEKDHYYRNILSVRTRVRFLDDFTGIKGPIDSKTGFDIIVPLEVRGIHFHFYVASRGKNEYYIVIDALQKTSLRTFLEVCNSILLTYAFLKGDYHGKQAYILSFANKKLESPSAISTILLGGGIYNGFAIHSTKPYTIIKFQDELRFGKYGMRDRKKEEQIKKYRTPFPAEAYANLCRLICTKRGVLRGIVLFVANHTAVMELKVPTLFVALENITKVLIKKTKELPLLIPQPEIIEDVKKIIKQSVKEIDKIARKHRPSDESLRQFNSNFERIKGKFNDFNKGTNNQKLAEPFVEFGYELSKEEEDLIFVQRNKFLHGDDIITYEKSYELEFKQLFHMSMRLQKLIAILLLKGSGYTGYILNNAKIYEQISDRHLDEDVYIFI